MTKKATALSFSWIALLLGAPLAAEPDDVQFSRPVLGMGQEVTHVVDGADYVEKEGGIKNRGWILPTTGTVDFQARRDERLNLEVMIGVTYFAAPYQYAQPQNYVRNISLTVPRLTASYAFGDVADPLLKVDVGIFNYKYNENARNLGEYMFRSWAYPGIIFTGGTYGYVNNNSATLTGIRMKQSLGAFSHELLLNVETEMTPIYDLNLTYMARFNYRNIFTVGGGVQLARFVNADIDPNMSVHYFKHNGTTYVSDPEGVSYYSSLQQGIQEKMEEPGLSAADSARLQREYDRVTEALRVNDSIAFGQIHPDIKSYSAKAIKPDLYFSFDPKPLLGIDAFGPRDMVIYGEAAILGVQDRPVYYEDIWQRIPMMMGFNIPTFKVLDVLTVEAEYYGNRWLPTYRVQTGSGGGGASGSNAVPTPLMDANAGNYYPTDWDKDNWKWSIYAEKTLVRGVSFSVQAASDHSRTWDWVTYGKTPWEMYTTPSEWYWSSKLSVRI
ncbi:MAG TPA: hypothetical protein VHO02_04645 [Fibrobacteria bacterium]|nr:hypothetical protein [Fibrobacteria bacterium]